MNYYIRTFGCQMNESDSERFATVLEQLGYSSVEEYADADIIVLNTCSVRQTAENRAVGLLRHVEKLKAERPEVVCILTGCMATKQGHSPSQKSAIGQMKAKLPAVDILMDVQDLGKLPELLKPFVSDISAPAVLPTSYLDIKPSLVYSFEAYVPISTGCNNFCTFCVVPYTRGREVSRPMADILEECREHLAAGVKRITLLGQNVDSYGKDLDVSFADLLLAINALEGDFWVHFTSNNPQDMLPEVIAAVREGEHLQPYIHFPLQAGSEDVLRRMARKHTLAEYRDLYESLRREIPFVSVTTDIIVGFPGETEEDFNETAAAMEEFAFDMAYINQYSPRVPAPSASMKDDVSSEEKHRRDHALTAVLKKSAFERNQVFIGEVLRCLVREEYVKREGVYRGLTPQMKLIEIASSDSLVVGEFVDVNVVHATPWKLIGEV